MPLEATSPRQELAVAATTVVFLARVDQSPIVVAANRTPVCKVQEHACATLATTWTPTETARLATSRAELAAGVLRPTASPASQLWPTRQEASAPALRQIR